MKKSLVRPTLEEIQQEINRRRALQSHLRFLRSALYALVVISAVTILIFTLWLPVFRITGSSMQPTLMADEMVLSVKTDHVQIGDIIAFYHNNEVLMKRVIATAGQYVDIQEDGTVLVDGMALDEPYVCEAFKGECSIPLPCQVGEGQFFVMGDNRPVSVDSRSASIGTISRNQILGRVFFRIWPFSDIGKVK